MRVPIVLDRASASPLHRQVYDEWRQAILSGRLRAGDRLPSTRELAAGLGVSRTTVTAAYDQLTAEGYLDSTRGSGTFVSRELPDDLLRSTRHHTTAAGSHPPVRLSQYGTRLGPGFARPRPQLDAINLSALGPDLEYFPFQLWRRTIARHLRNTTAAGYEYGAHTAGYEPLRQQIAAFVARSRAVRCAPDQVIVVNGSQQALDLCARVLLDVGDEVAVEDPGYRGGTHLFAAHGARLRPVRVTSDGIDVDGLTPTTRFVYVTPSHQFPTGVSMSLARRLELVEWARPTGAVILEDDYDSVYRYSGAPLPALQSLASGVAVIYMGTFSNVMFPGLRIGYLVVPRDLVPPLTQAKWLSDRHTSMLEQAALADLLREGHLDRHIRRMGRLYKRRRDAMVDALRRNFGTRVSIYGDAAGMHLFVRFQSNTVRRRARQNGVHIEGAEAYYLSRPPDNEFFLSFSAIGERAIREGIRRLAAR